MNPKTRVKICGITRPVDAEEAAALGADAIGIIFYPASRRAVADLGLAREIAAAVGPFVTVTALFVNEEVKRVEQILANTRVDCLQFHGDETSSYCEQFGRAHIKALAARPDMNLTSQALSHSKALAVVIDTFKPGEAGGTGQTFDWGLVPENLPKPLILAGGLNPANVAAAVDRTAPYAVDVSGGVEAVNAGVQQFGVKDYEKMATFIRRAKFGDSE